MCINIICYSKMLALILRCAFLSESQNVYLMKLIAAVFNLYRIGLCN